MRLIVLIALLTLAAACGEKRNAPGPGVDTTALATTTAGHARTAGLTLLEAWPPFGVGGRVPWGNNPVEWWVVLEKGDLNADVNLDGGLGEITLAADGHMAVHLNGQPSDAKFYVECRVTAKPEDRLVWSAVVGAIKVDGVATDTGPYRYFTLPASGGDPQPTWFDMHFEDAKGAPTTGKVLGCTTLMFR